MTEILKVLVGSHAHGLATPESDRDIRGVFVHPTSELLKLGAKPHNSQWIEGDVDNTSYEIGHFLFLATKSNPTILETFVAPVLEANQTGVEMRALFPYVYSDEGVYNAFQGYGFNQRTKFLMDKDKRAHKYAVAWLRTLIMAFQLITLEELSLDITNTLEYNRLKRWKAGEWRLGEVMEVTNDWRLALDDAYAAKVKKKVTDTERVNDFLLSVRKENW